MNKLLSLLLLFSLSLSASDNNSTNHNFKPLYSFINTSVNYLDWSKASENKTAYTDFTYLELEGGVGWTWGEFYGFIDIENPTSTYSEDSSNNLRVAVKPIIDINLYKNFALHIQDYYFTSENFYVSNLVTGVSYKYSAGYDFWIKPFIGVHYQNDTYYSGWNGYMAGWVFNYNFNIFEEKISISQWHEIEFNRDKEYYQLNDGTPIGDGKSHAMNGALSLWWHINKNFTAGLQYRYTDNKLGYANYLSAGIYTLKYKF